MSILIKGMDMPKNCHECVFGKYEVCAINISVEKKDTITHSCPLVEVHEPHGRLIDADEILKENKYNGIMDVYKIAIAPTIIEAEN